MAWSLDNGVLFSYGQGTSMIRIVFLPMQWTSISFKREWQCSVLLYIRESWLSSGHVGFLWHVCN